MYDEYELASYVDVTNYLYDKKPSSLDLNDFKSNEHVTNFDGVVPELLETGIEHDTSLKLTNTDNIIFNFDETVRKIKLDKFNKVQLTLISNTTLDIDEVTAYFSRTPNAKLNYQTIVLNTVESIQVDDMINLVFDIVDEDGEDNSNFLADIRSLAIILPTTTDVTICNVSVKQTAFDLYMPIMDYQFNHGTDYLRSKLNVEDIPSEMKYNIAKYAAAHIYWAMYKDEGTTNTTDGKFYKDYGTKLMNEIDDSIQDYREAHFQSDPSNRFLDTRMWGAL